MSKGAKGQAAKLLASWGQPPQTPAVLGRGTMMVNAAARAAVTSGVGDGVALGVAEVGVGLERLVAVVVAPQPTKATTAAADSRPRMSFSVGGNAIALGWAAGRERDVSMLVELTWGSFVTHVAVRSEKVRVRNSSPCRASKNEAAWSGGRDSNSRSPGPKPEAKAYRIRLDLSSTYSKARKSLNSSVGRAPPLTSSRRDRRAAATERPPGSPFATTYGTSLPAHPSAAIHGRRECPSTMKNPA
jgi:hypothetical protein